MNKIEEIYNKVKEINSLKFKKQKEETIKEANEILENAEETIIVITDKHTLINGSPIDLIRLLDKTIDKITSERGMPKELVSKILEKGEPKNDIDDIKKQLESMLEAFMED